MQIKLQNGPWEKTVDLPSVEAALGWAVVNWHPAQGVRNPKGGFYLSPHLLLSIDGAPLRNVMDVMAERQAA